MKFLKRNYITFLFDSYHISYCVLIKKCYCAGTIAITKLVQAVLNRAFYNKLIYTKFDKFG